jgi:hypothetical protein
MEIRTSQGAVVPITNVLILLVLMVITGLLISIYFQQRAISRQQALLAPDAVPATLATPVVAPTVVPEAPAPAAPVRRVTPVNTRNYTQPQAQLSPAPVAPPTPRATPAPAAVAPAPANATPSLPPPPAPVYSYPAYEPAPSVATAPAYTPYPPTNPDLLDPPERLVDTTIPSGTILTVRLVDMLNSDDLRAGDHFRATLDAPIYVDGMTIATEGSTVEGRVVDVQQAGRVTGVAELRVELSRLMLGNGQAVDLLTDTVTQFGEASKKADAAKVGTGAAIGAVLGAITGGGKGAAIGAATGAGAGTAGVLLTRGKPVVLEPETRLSFQLRSPVSVSNSGGFDSDYSYASPSRSNLPADMERQRPRLRRR